MRCAPQTQGQDPTGRTGRVTHLWLSSQGSASQALLAVSGMPPSLDDHELSGLLTADCWLLAAG